MTSLCQTPANLATSQDDYISSLMDQKLQPVWHARLSNGLTIIQDDGRPGMDISSAWIRLGNYCREQQVKIEKLWVKFRSNVVDELPEFADGYFFSKGVIKTMDSEHCLYSYLIGHQIGNKVYVNRYSTPALILIQQSCRESDGIQEALIRNNECQSSITQTHQLT